MDTLDWVLFSTAHLFSQVRVSDWISRISPSLALSVGTVLHWGPWGTKVGNCGWNKDCVSAGVMKQNGHLIIVDVLVPIVTVIFYTVVNAHLEANVMRLTVQAVICCVNCHLRVWGRCNPGLSWGECEIICPKAWFSLSLRLVDLQQVDSHWRNANIVRLYGPGGSWITRHSHLTFIGVHSALVNSSELNGELVRVGRGMDRAAVPAVVVGAD